MKAYSDKYLEKIIKINGDEKGRRSFRTGLEEGNAYWNHRLTSASYVPVCLSVEDRLSLMSASETIYSILKKVINRYRKDKAFRKEFCFDPRIEEMILFPLLYEEELPLMRTDSLYEAGTGELYYCEFNTDASGGMTETFETIKNIKGSKPYLDFSKDYSVITDEKLIFEGWVKSFRHIIDSITVDAINPQTNRRNPQIDRRNNSPVELSYSQASQIFTKKRLAIVVCLDSPNPDVRELTTFVTYFEEAGFEVSVFDVRELKYNNGMLIGLQALFGESNVSIDCIWRFCIVVDLLEHWEDVQDFIMAAREGAIPMIGGFVTQIVADKQIFAVLRKFRTDDMFTPEESDFIDKHIPFTAFISNMLPEGIDHELSIKSIRENKNEWIIKPTDRYASIGVTSGRSCSDEEWNELINRCLEDKSPFTWLVQRFIEPCISPAIPIYGKEEDYYADSVEYGCLFGTYVYCGDYGGVYLRQGPQDVIGDARGGVTSLVLWCTPV